MKDFRELRVYKEAIECFKELLLDLKNIPEDNVTRVIINQVIRSVSSISANIAEGYGRSAGKEYRYFLYVARGSTSESIDWYEKMRILKYIDIDRYNSQIKRLEYIRAMLTKMINRIKI